MEQKCSGWYEMRIKYVVPSYKRAKTISTLDYLSRAVAVVAEREVEEYKKNHPGISEERFIVCPDDYQGKGKPRVLNWILDNLFDDCDVLVEMDDDITCYMAHVKNGNDRVLAEDEVYEIFENISRLAVEWGCGMWGISPNSDPLVYDEFVPFRLHAYIDGGTVGHVIKNELRYDEELSVKEDVDFFLQNIKKYHKALRVEKYYVRKESFTNEGGANEIRTEELEQEQFTRMQKKWGSNVIRPNRPVARKSSKIRGYGGAIKLNIPLGGS